MSTDGIVGTWRLVEVQLAPGDAAPWDSGLLTYACGASPQA